MRYVWLGVLAMAPVWGWATTAGVITPENLTRAGNFSDTKLNYKQMMNFNDCLNFKFRPCVHFCPTPLGPKPTPGVQFEYREPVGLTVAKCRQGSRALDGSAGVLSGALTASSLKPDQACTENRQREDGLQQRTFFDATLYNASSIGARVRSSATPLQAVQSLTCGVAGMVGLFVNPLNPFNLRSIPINVQPAAPSQPPAGLPPMPADAQARSSVGPGGSLALHERPVVVRQFGSGATGAAAPAGAEVMPAPPPLPPLMTAIPRADGQGLAQNGSSQLAASAALGQVENTVQLFSNIAAEARHVATLARTENTPTTLCAARTTLLGSVRALNGFLAVSVSNTRAGVELVPPGTFLGMDFQQEIDDQRPIPSCPLTHAGVVLVPTPGDPNGYTKQTLNCREVCKGQEDRRECERVPLEGYGGNCENNVLSQVVYAGMLPACNGLTAEWQADEDGRMVRRTPQYVPEHDHRRRLNAFLDQGLRDAGSAAAIIAVGALREVVEAARAQNIQCTDDGQPQNRTQGATPGRDLMAQQLRTRQFAAGSDGVLPQGPGLSTGLDLSRLAPVDLTSIMNTVPGLSQLGGSGVAAAWSQVQGLGALAGPAQGLAGLNSLTSGASQAVQGVMAPLNSAFSQVSNQISTLTAPLTQSLTQLSNATASALNTITGPLNQAMGAISGAVNQVTSGISSAVGSAFGSLGLPAGLGLGEMMAGLNAANAAVDTTTELMRAGGVGQFARGQLACLDPSGLCPVWKSELAQPQWATPPMDIRTAIMPAINTAGGFLCTGPQVLTDLGRMAGGASNVATGITNPLCNCFGDTCVPSVGWAYHRETAMAAANIFAKTTRIGTSLHLIRADTSGKGMMFSYEFPQINRGSEATAIVAPSLGGGSHPSSKCYAMGSLDPRWRTKGESLIPNLAGAVPTDVRSLLPTTQANAHDGYFAFAAWKHTKCCIPLACPLNIRRDY